MENKESYSNIEYPQGILGEMAEMASTPHDEPNPLPVAMAKAEHISEQMGGLLQVFQEASIHLMRVNTLEFTWPNALGDVLDEYGWAIISLERLAELQRAEIDLQNLKRIFRKHGNE